MSKELEEKLFLEYSKTTDLDVLMMENKVAKPMISLNLILEDIELAREAAKRAMGLNEIRKIGIDPLFMRALWQQSIMAYARIFTKSNDGFSKLEASDYIISKKDMKLHQQLMEIRHGVLAHRGINPFERTIMTVIPAEYEGKSVLAFSFPKAKRIGYYLSKGERTLYFNLLDKLERRVNRLLTKKLRKIESRLMKDFKKVDKTNNEKGT